MVILGELGYISFRQATKLAPTGKGWPDFLDQLWAHPEILPEKRSAFSPHQADGPKSDRYSKVLGLKMRTFWVPKQFRFSTTWGGAIVNAPKAVLEPKK